MKAIAVTSGNGNLEVIDRPEPAIHGGNEVKLKVLEVGICGTDRQEVHQASEGEVDSPPGAHELVIGHEMIGQVLQTGGAVRSVQAGDYALFSVRRGCGQCAACAMNRSDMCYTGKYTERGIKGRDGYQTEMVVDIEQYLVKVPTAISRFAVLCEPTSVTEKAIDETVRVQTARLPDCGDPAAWLKGKPVLVAGLGPIGLLAAMALLLRGATVFGMDVVDAGTNRPRLLERLGGTYIDGRRVQPDRIHEHFGAVDLIFEATGVPKVEFDLLSSLGVNGIYVLTGVPEPDRCLDLDGGTLIRNMVLKNQIMIGSVNAAPMHFAMAIEDLQKAHSRWPGALEEMITSRVPHDRIDGAFTQHPADEIKTVIEWS